MTLSLFLNIHIKITKFQLNFKTVNSKVKIYVHICTAYIVGYNFAVDGKTTIEPTVSIIKLRGKDLYIYVYGAWKEVRRNGR
jgi:hypothetical protein